MLTLVDDKGVTDLTVLAIATLVGTLVANEVALVVEVVESVTRVVVSIDDVPERFDVFQFGPVISKNMNLKPIRPFESRILTRPQNEDRNLLERITSSVFCSLS